MFFDIFTHKRLYLAYLLMAIVDIPLLGVFFIFAPLFWMMQVFIVTGVLFFSKTRWISLLLMAILSGLFCFWRMNFHSPDAYYVVVFTLLPLWVGVWGGFVKEETPLDSVEKREEKK